MIKYVWLILLLSCSATKQVDIPVVISDTIKPVIAKQENYVMYWKANAEKGLDNYKLQQSSNNRNFTTIITVKPTFKKDSNNYTYTLPTPKTSRYFRIQSTMKNKKIYMSDTIYVKLTK